MEPARFAEPRILFEMTSVLVRGEAGLLRSADIAMENASWRSGYRCQFHLNGTEAKLLVGLSVLYVVNILTHCLIGISM